MTRFLAGIVVAFSFLVTVDYSVAGKCPDGGLCDQQTCGAPECTCQRDPITYNWFCNNYFNNSPGPGGGS